MNDIPFASIIFETIIHADDTTLVAKEKYFYLKNKTKLNINMLIRELNKLKLWLRANTLTSNTQKSKFILFYQPKTHIKINNECAEQIYFLRLIFYKHLI